MSNITDNKKKSAMGWKIVLACLLIQAVPYAILAFLQPQFQAYVLQDKALGFNIATFSLVFSIGTLASAVASPIVGGLFKKFGLKTMYLGGALIGCGGFAAYSIATQPWHFYVIAALVQVGSAILSSIGIPMILNSWFDQSSQGKKLSTVVAGGSLANAVLQPVCVSLIEGGGFRQAYFIFGVVGLVVAIPVILFMLRLPKDDSEIIRSSSNEETKEEAKWGYTVKEAMKTNGFKMLVFGFFFVGIYSSALTNQYPNYLHQNHAINTGTVGSMLAIGSFMGSIIGGFLFDKIGPFKTMLLGGIMTLVADLSLANALDVTALGYVFAVANGLSIFAYIMGPALLVGKLFGNKEFAGILGMVQLVFGLGFALGSSLFGVLVRKVGYIVSWYTMGAAIVISFVVILTAIKAMNKLNKSNIENKKDEVKEIA